MQICVSPPECGTIGLCNDYQISVSRTLFTECHSSKVSSLRFWLLRTIRSLDKHSWVFKVSTIPPRSTASPLDLPFIMHRSLGRHAFNLTQATHTVTVPFNNGFSFWSRRRGFAKALLPLLKVKYDSWCDRWDGHNAVSCVLRCSIHLSVYISAAYEISDQFSVQICVSPPDCDTLGLCNGYQISVSRSIFTECHSSKISSLRFWLLRTIRSLDKYS